MIRENVTDTGVRLTPDEVKIRELRQTIAKLEQEKQAQFEMHFKLICHLDTYTVFQMRGWAETLQEVGRLLNNGTPDPNDAEYWEDGKESLESDLRDMQEQIRTITNVINRGADKVL